MKRESAFGLLSRFALRRKRMERKRIAGRFAAEDKGGVVKKQPAPQSRAKSLVGLLLDKWKQKACGAAPHAAD